MLFSEIYGSYFNVVAAVLTEAGEETLTAGKLTAIVQEKAFAESVLSIPAALQSDAWPLLDSNFHTVLREKPTIPDSRRTLPAHQASPGARDAPQRQKAHPERLRAEPDHAGAGRSGR